MLYPNVCLHLLPVKIIRTHRDTHILTLFNFNEPTEATSVEHPKVHHLGPLSLLRN